MKLICRSEARVQNIRFRDESQPDLAELHSDVADGEEPGQS